jgi:hypothetical protein
MATPERGLPALIGAASHQSKRSWPPNGSIARNLPRCLSCPGTQGMQPSPEIDGAAPLMSSRHASIKLERGRGARSLPGNPFSFDHRVRRTCGSRPTMRDIAFPGRSFPRCRDQPPSRSWQRSMHWCRGLAMPPCRSDVGPAINWCRWDEYPVALINVPHL